MSENVIVYHYNCADGFGALWAATSALAHPVEAIPGIYNASAPDLSRFADKHVYILDFSYPPPLLCAICAVARSVTWLDHHVSAINAWREYVQQATSQAPANLTTCLDNDYSGAVLAWRHFYDEEPPLMLRYIQDRDLWHFKMPNSREINAYIFSLSYDLGLWAELMAIQPDSPDYDSAVASGRAILRKQAKDIDEIIGAAAGFVCLGDHKNIPVLNVPYMWASEACHKMLQLNSTAPFVASYFISGKQALFSLRSRNNENVDVSAIAVAHGGGGHKHAAGFSMPLNELSLILTGELST